MERSLSKYVTLSCCLTLLLSGVARGAATSEGKPVLSATCARIWADALPETYGYLDQIDGVAARVPSTEAIYLEKEYEASLAAKDTQRLNAMIGRPYFYAWQLHLKIDRARKALDQVKQLSPDTAPKAHIQAAALSQADLATVYDAWQAYENSPLAGNLPTATIQKTVSQAVSLQSAMTPYIWCWADLVQGP